MKQNTIVAIATGTSIAGIAIVRMSGEQSFEIAAKLLPCLRAGEMEPRKLYLTDIVGQGFADKGLVVKFKAPYSFTGEDIVEFQIHGGQMLATLVVKECMRQGARLADPGEFSKRAFINGKISLEGAEGIIDLIQAQSEAEIKAGYSLVRGALKEKTERLQGTLTDLIAEIEVALDYPEHDIEYETKENVKLRTQTLLSEIEILIGTAGTGKLIKNGINVAILGRPNAGKSSLLNSLLQFERAIVTDIEGTTRDTIEESYAYRGVRVNLIDTAGIRSAENIVEQMGIEKAKKTLEYCNVVLFVIDTSLALNEQDRQVITLLKEHNTIPVIVVLNKSDVKDGFLNDNKKAVQEELQEAKYIEVSAKWGDNTEQLKGFIYDIVLSSKLEDDGLFITSTRHLTALQAAARALEGAIASCDSISLDCVALDLRDAWTSLGHITGKSLGEEVVDAIFSKFCLGK